MMRQSQEYFGCFYSQFHARRTHLNIIGKAVGHQVSDGFFSSARGAEPRVKTSSSNNHQQKVA